MKTATELRVQRIVTRGFIDADKVLLTLHTMIEGTGNNRGILIDGPDRPPQVFRLIPQTISYVSGGQQGVNDQSTQTFLYVLMGHWDCDMALYDWWEDESTGQMLQVTTMMPDNGYQRKGLIAQYKRAM